MSEVYAILAPKDSTVADVSRMAIEIYLDEDHPPEHLKVESLGVDPSGMGVWSVEVVEPPEAAQEAHTGDDRGSPGDSIPLTEGES